MDEATLLKDGWMPLNGVRYAAAIGPTFARRSGGKVIVALLAQEHLANDNLGIVHGGAIMTFVDIAFGFGVGQSNDGKSNFVTAQTQIQFIAAARVGDLITCEPEVIRKTSQLVFVRGLLEVGGRTIAAADGMFKLIDLEKAAVQMAGRG